MSTTPTTNYGWAKPDVATEDNTWGTLLNAIFDWLDSILGGRNNISVAGGAGTTTLTAEQAKPSIQEFTGVLTGNREVHFPAKNRWHVIRNATSGAFTLTAKISGGTGVVLPQGEVSVVYFDGTDCRRAPSAGALGLDSFTGDIGTTGNLSITGTGSFISTDAGAAAGPSVTLYRNSASPAANDVMGALLLDGEDSAGNQQTYVRAQGVIVDATSASEDGRLSLATVIAGTLADRLHLQAGLYTDGVTGGDKGAGSINVASLYINGALASDVIGIPVADDLEVVTSGTGKYTFRMPFAMTVSAVRASLVTAQTSGTVVTVDINDSGTTILSTKLTIDNGEKTSTTAATAAVISDTALADDAEITVDVDAVGDGTAKGLKVYIYGTRA